MWMTLIFNTHDQLQLGPAENHFITNKRIINVAQKKRLFFLTSHTCHNISANRSETISLSISFNKIHLNNEFCKRAKSIINLFQIHAFLVGNKPDLITNIFIVSLLSLNIFIVKYEFIFVFKKLLILKESQLVQMREIMEINNGMSRADQSMRPTKAATSDSRLLGQPSLSTYVPLLLLLLLTELENEEEGQRGNVKGRRVLS